MAVILVFFGFVFSTSILRPVHVFGKEHTCSQSNVTILGSEYVWPETPTNTTLVISCQSYAIGNVSRKCAADNNSEGGASWSRVNLTACQNIHLASFMASIRAAVSEQTMTQSVASLLSDLTTLIRDAVLNNSLYPSDLVQSTRFVEAVSTGAHTFSHVQDVNSLANEYGKAVSTLTSRETFDVWTEVKDKDTVITTSANLLFAMEEMASGLYDIIQTGNVTSQTNITVVEENLDFELHVLSDDINGDISFHGKNGSSLITIPKRLVNVSTDEDGKFGFYRAQYETISYLLNMKEIPDPSGSNVSVAINSKILSARFVGPDTLSTMHFPAPLTITLKHDNPALPHSTVYCAFLGTTDSSYSWSVDGCHLVSTNQSHTVCQCYHLTNFALIMDLYEIHISDVHEKALSYISYIGGTLSLVGCLLSVSTYEFFRLSSERIRVHEMLAVSIVLTQFVFFVGFERTKYTYLCRSFAILLHYALTSMFCWMLVEGIHLYVSLVKVFRRSSNLRKYCVIGWGIPFVIVIISAAVFFNEYGSRYTCWLSTHLLLIAFIPFVTVTIVINLSVMILVIRVMLKSMKKYSRNEDIPAAKSSLKAIVTLMPLLGLTWAFGFLSVDDENTLVFTYLFAIFNSLQGVFFFVFHCLLNNDVKRAYERRYRRNVHSSSSNPVKIQTGKDSGSCDVGSCRDSPPPVKSASDVMTEKVGLARKRSSAISIDSTDTNMTVVEENGNNTPPESHADDFVYFSRTSTSRRRSGASGRSVGTGTGTASVTHQPRQEGIHRQEGTSTDVTRTDRYDVRIEADAVFDCACDELVRSDICITHM